MNWIRRAIRLDVYRKLLMDSPEVPESIKTNFLPNAEQDMLDIIAIKYNVPVHERIDETFYKEKPGMPELRHQILDDVHKRKKDY